MQTKQTSKWIVDVILFLGFIGAFLFDLTGLELHQWIGVAVVVLSLYHFITHWCWFDAITRRFLGRTGNRTRLCYVLDVAILAGFMVITLTGLVVSPWLGLTLANASGWMEAHILVSIITLLIVVLKIGLHWRWLATVAKTVFPKSTARSGNFAPATAPASQHTNRREFLEVMGVVGISSVIALSQAAEGLDAYTGEPAGRSASGYLSGSDLPCAVKCVRRCSFPGQCNRYIDTNGNNRCDHGECTGNALAESGSGAAPGDGSVLPWDAPQAEISSERAGKGYRHRNGGGRSSGFSKGHP